jgi:glycosyltransferase involved in cell wall biosynthesis
MRLLVVGAVLDHRWKGGEPLIADFIVKGLKKKGFEVITYGDLRNRKKRIGSYLSMNDINIYVANYYRELIKVHKPDIVLSFYDYDCSICLASHKENIPFIVSVNIWWPICPTLSLYINKKGLCEGPTAVQCIRCMSSSAFSYKKVTSLFLYTKFLKRIKLLNLANKIIVPSHYMERKLSRFGIKNIKTIYYGIDVNKITPTKWIFNDKKLIIDPTGYTDERKGFSHFIELAKNLRNEFDDVHFIAAGYKGSNNIIKGVGWLPRNDLIKLIQQSYLVIIPSLWEEPFGIVAIESMAAGKPVITYDTGGLSEVIINGVTGFTIPRGNIKGLINATRYLLKNEELSIKMGLEGRKRAEQYFNLEQMINEYVYELSKCISDSYVQ